jgi:hypothetical protein
VHQSRRVRGASLAAPLISLALCLPCAAFAPGVSAQDATAEPVPTDLGGIDLEPAGSPSAFCSVLTAAEASAPFGVTLTVGTSSDTDCSYDSDFVTSDLSLLVARDVGDLELDAQDIFPDGRTVDVAGHAGWYTPEGLALFVDAGDGQLFSLELFGTPADDLDLQAALTGLAELALPRLGAIPIPPEPTDEPQPSYEGDPVLQALIPASVGDAEMVVDVYSGHDLIADTDPSDPDAQASIADLQDVLAAQGKSISDVSFANAYFATDTAYGDLFAVRVAGAHVAEFQDALVDLILQFEDPQRSTSSIAGRPVTVITDGPPATGTPDPSADPFDLPLPPSYVYAAGEVLFIVSADEPQLTQLFQELPEPVG